MGKGTTTKKKKHKHSIKCKSAKATSAAKLVAEWAFPAGSSCLDRLSTCHLNDHYSAVVFDLHTHSACSDGMLSPEQLVEKAAASRVQVISLTDHDSMEGVPMAIERARKLGVRVIPGVEISTTRIRNGSEESVHILGYYSCCGPSRWPELESSLCHIREGRYQRALHIVNKLEVLRRPICWERVLSIAGDGVAPGRVHIARALVEAGHVVTLREAFDKYLYDGGPAYAQGHELPAADAVRLVCNTGGVAVLAHPWTLKDPLPLIKQLKDAGLQGMEVYRGDGKASGYADMATAYGLLKLGGSDFHGKGEPDKTKLGAVPLPVLSIAAFLSVAQPLWMDAVKEMLQCFSQETFEVLSDKVVGLRYFSGLQTLKGDVSVDFSVEEGKHIASLRLSAWLTEEEREAVKAEAGELGLRYKILPENVVVSRNIL